MLMLTLCYMPFKLLPIKMEGPARPMEVEMDTRVWCELPDHIVYKILALLPLRSFLRLRWVCRRWSDLIESPVFLDEFSQRPVENPWFAIIGDARKVYVYVPPSEKWYSMPPSFLPQNSVYLASDKGLILSRVSRRGQGLEDLLVMHNPFTKSQKVLSAQNLYGCGYAMVADENNKDYKVYHFGQLQPWVSSNFEDDHAIEAFCSTTNNWQVLGRVNPEIFNGLPSYAFDDTKILVCNDYVFCRLRGYFGMFGYNLKYHTWLSIPWVVSPSLSAFQQLLRLNSRLIMVVGIKEDSSDPGCKSIHLWELQRGSLRWHEVGMVPKEMNLMRYNFDSYSHGDYIFMLYATRLLYHNVAANTWSFAPPCDRICENFQEFCFEPKLAAVP